MARRDGFFRGSEFPRLLVLLGIMLVGWALVFYYFVVHTPKPRAVPQAPRVAE
ncbi:MAG: hypothetical protein IRY99_23195, partial [Isosphaeraceae bacterium]|nr:hypothetical protein [Isosphaeraceae bacterium]